MSLSIENIYLSNEGEWQPKAGTGKAETDVIVVLTDGTKFHASFFSFAGLQDLHDKHFKSGEYLNGAYFWSKGMILIEECSRERIEKVVLDLFEEGEFQESFQKL